MSDFLASLVQRARGEDTGLRPVPVAFHGEPMQELDVQLRLEVEEETVPRRPVSPSERQPQRDVPPPRRPIPGQSEPRQVPRPVPDADAAESAAPPNGRGRAPTSPERPASPGDRAEPMREAPARTVGAVPEVATETASRPTRAAAPLPGRARTGTTRSTEPRPGAIPATKPAGRRPAAERASARLAGAPGAGRRAEPERTVTVSIGRVEVRTPAAPAPPPIPAASAPGPRQSLDDWLAEHERERRT